MNESYIGSLRAKYEIPQNLAGEALVQRLIQQVQLSGRNSEIDELAFGELLKDYQVDALRTEAHHRLKAEEGDKQRLTVSHELHMIYAIGRRDRGETVNLSYARASVV